MGGARHLVPARLGERAARGHRPAGEGPRQARRRARGAGRGLRRVGSGPRGLDLPVGGTARPCGVPRRFGPGRPGRARAVPAAAGSVRRRALRRGAGPRDGGRPHRGVGAPGRGRSPARRARRSLRSARVGGRRGPAADRPRLPGRGGAGPQLEGRARARRGGAGGPARVVPGRPRPGACLHALRTRGRHEGDADGAAGHARRPPGRVRAGGLPGSIGPGPAAPRGGGCARSPRYADRGGAPRPPAGRRRPVGGDRGRGRPGRDGGAGPRTPHQCHERRGCGPAGGLGLSAPGPPRAEVVPA